MVASLFFSQMNRIILFISLLSLVFPPVMAALPLHCGADTLTVERLLEVGAGIDSSGKRVVMAAESFIGAPLDKSAASDPAARVTLDLHSFTPLSLINTCVALAQTLDAKPRSGWRDYADALQNISCRRGEDDGFASMMYHASDWIGDNVYRGNLTELTENYSGAIAKTKSLDWLTRHRKDFAALADSATYEKVRMTELGFRTHRVPMLKKETVNKREVADDLRDGDILVLIPYSDGTDIYDIGIVAFKDETPYLIHISPVEHKVVMEKDPLPRYFKLRDKNFAGYRIVRPKFH